MTSLDRRSLAWAMALSMLAGYVDSLGFIELGGYFVSFMSGNTTRLGLALGHGNWYQAWIVAGIIGLFVLGVVFGSLLASRAGRARRPVILFLVAGLLVASAIFYGMGLLRAGTAAMLLAMGAENTILRRDGVSIGLTYMTGNLVRMGHSIADALQGGSKRDWLRYFALWLALALGATLGTVAHRFLGMNGLWLGAAAAATLGFASRMKMGQDRYPY